MTLALAVAAALAATGPAGIAVAADAPATVSLDEVIVTSRRVEERLQDTPISVSAFQAEDIEARTIRNIGDAANFTPNFVSNPGPTGGNDGFFFIRGVGQTDLNAATDPGVATYVDGVYLGRLVGASMDTVDLARIEVLRGPQGTFFGRNTIGGAVSVTTRDPGKDFDGYVALGGGSRDRKRAEGSMDLPVTDQLSILLSGLYKGQNGWVERPSDGVTFGDTLSRVGRVKIKYSPSADFSATLSLERDRVTGTSEANSLVGFNSNAISPLGIPMNPAIGASLVQPGPALFTSNSNVNPILDLKVSGYTLTLDGKAGEVGLKSISAYRSVEHYSQGDFDGSPYSFYDQAFTTRQHQISEELQASRKGGRIEWLVGAFFYKEDAFHDNQIDLGGNNGCSYIPFPFLPPQAICTVPNYQTANVSRAITNNQQIEVKDRSYAAYGNTTWKFTDAWSGSVGLRWTNERKEQSYNFFIDNTGNVFNLAGLPPIVLPTLSPNNPFVGVPTAYETSWSEVTPSAGLEYRFSPDAQAYLNYARGFKSGGYNGRPTPGQNGQFGTISPYDPETIDTYELGIKSEWFERRLRFNAAAFYSNYKGIQLLALNPATGFFDTVNAARSKITGVEVELAAKPIDGLELQAAAGVMHNEYKELSAGAIASGIVYGNKLPLTPDFNASVGAQYRWQLARGSFALRGDYSYRSEVFFEADNFSNARQGGYGLLSARATYEFDDGRVSVSAYGLNLGGKIYVTNGQDVVGPLGVAFDSVGAPREWGFDVRYKFGK